MSEKTKILVGSKGRKTGRFTKDEVEYLQLNAINKTANEMAEFLKRDPISVTKWVNKNIQNKDIARFPIARPELGLKGMPEWKQCQKQFTQDELDFLEYRYEQLIKQFNEDGILATEYPQIFLLVKYEIFMDRNAADRQMSINEIKNLTAEYNSLIMKGDLDKNEKDMLSLVGTQLTAIRASEISRTKEYTELQARHASILKDLKGTREQRIKNIKESKVSFIELIKQLQEKDIQEEVSIQTELAKQAIEREHKKLGKIHTYIDGSQDRILLSEETVGLKEEEDGAENNN